ncbi:MAG: hypothetical protein Fur0042_16880 [Cyanophyceae cyanobacterium]
MGKAGQALRQALAAHGISQNQLAVKLDIKRSSVYRWCHELRDPNGETIVQIAIALREINPAAADEFVRLYLGDYLKSNR